MLRYKDLEEAINIILSQVNLIELVSADSYIKLYQVKPDGCPTEATAASEIIKGGHLVSRVPLNSKGLRDGEEDMLVLFRGIPLLRRYWRQGVRVKRSDYIAQINTLLDEVGIPPVLHSIITNF